MSTPRYRSAPPSLSGSAMTVSKATIPSSPGLKSDMGAPLTVLGGVRGTQVQLVMRLYAAPSSGLEFTPVPPMPAGSVPRGLSEHQMAAEPMTQFARWMADALASGLPEPTAMVLSTVTPQGGPRARTVLLKAHDQTGFTFYSNRTSRQVRELAADPSACL